MDALNFCTTAAEPLPESMNALLWVIVCVLAGVVGVGGPFVFRVIWRKLHDCEEDRKTLFADNENDRKEFYRENKKLNRDKLRLTREVAYVAGKCNVDLSEVQHPPETEDVGE